MIKKSIHLFLLLLFINGCAERGQVINLPQNMTEKKPMGKDADTSQQITSGYVLKLNAKKPEYDTIQNSVSGTMLLIIGIIILL